MSENLQTFSNGRPVIFGEVLFDIFPDHTVLGGAPFNVAWHLRGFGLDPLLISRIGNDDLGNSILENMSSWGMDKAGIQVDAEHPTGQVKISLHETSHVFEILPRQAYDFIEHKPALDVIGDSALFLYHGSLAVRTQPCLETLQHLRKFLRAPVFVDINLRDPWWNYENLLALMKGARWLKLNDEELDVLAQGNDSHVIRAESLRGRLGLESLILTLGEKGAALFQGGAPLTGTPELVVDIVDTVGAGDAFAAVTILGIVHGWPKKEILDRALSFAAEVCRNRGATFNNRSIYNSYIDQWHK